MINFEQKTPTELTFEVAQRVKARRKELGFTQAQMAERSGMPLASYKRFEQKGLVSFRSLAAIAIALNCESDLDELFAKRTYRSIEEVVAAAATQRRNL